MKDKLLVANRSEIACRIFRACREMGIGTVAVAAAGDEKARHVAFADEVYSIPSYLDMDSIIDIALETQARLIHPGYGFLAENAIFARKVERAGLVFIGPSSEMMEFLGDKLSAKALAKNLKIPTLSWTGISDANELERAARRIGLPVLLKSPAGGGGRGIRRVNTEQDLARAAESASREVLSTFGSGEIFLEKYLEKPRHIEVQLFGDGAGNVVHLYERDCSLQRRYQKFWEEAPAMSLFPETRKKIQQAALQLAEAVKYRGAGTAEFLVTENGNYYFLEMNTRLQVEHPISEMITGVDIVQAQIEQALQPDITVIRNVPAIKGYAIEVRLCAEIPSGGFIPSTGRISRLRWPTGIGIRIDSGIDEGQTIKADFDPLLAKLVVCASDRKRALARLRCALDETVIQGVGTNQAYLRALCDHPAVQEGNVHISFIEDEVNLDLGSESRTGRKAMGFPSPWVTFGGNESRVHQVLSEPHVIRDAKYSEIPHLVAEFPGKVRKVFVQRGDKVLAGDDLVLVEAMKMEFAVRAPVSGRVLKVGVRDGQQILPGDRFLEIEAHA